MTACADDTRSVMEIADSIQTLVAAAKARAAPPSCPCGGTGRVSDHPCRCPAGATGRASLRADRRWRAEERRLAKARAASRAARDAVNASLRRLTYLEWLAGRARIIGPRGSRLYGAVIRATSEAQAAARRAALVERYVRGSPADVARRLRYDQEVARVRERARHTPERLNAVLERVLADLRSTSRS